MRHHLNQQTAKPSLNPLWTGCGFAGVHGLQTYSAGTVQLTPGPHPITVFYNQVMTMQRSHCRLHAA